MVQRLKTWHGVLIKTEKNWPLPASCLISCSDFYTTTILRTYTDCITSHPAVVFRLKYLRTNIPFGYFHCFTQTSQWHLSDQNIHTYLYKKTGVQMFITNN